MERSLSGAQEMAVIFFPDKYNLRSFAGEVFFWRPRKENRATAPNMSRYFIAGV
jgi:hypothetical protein